MLEWSGFWSSPSGSVKVVENGVAAFRANLKDIAKGVELDTTVDTIQVAVRALHQTH
jgi:hypothetical protein